MFCVGSAGPPIPGALARRMFTLFEVCNKRFRTMTCKKEKFVVEIVESLHIKSCKLQRELCEIGDGGKLATGQLAIESIDNFLMGGDCVQVHGIAHPHNNRKRKFNGSELIKSWLFNRFFCDMATEHASRFKTVLELEWVSVDEPNQDQISKELAKFLLQLSSQVDIFLVLTLIKLLFSFLDNPQFDFSLSAALYQAVATTMTSNLMENERSCTNIDINTKFKAIVEALPGSTDHNDAGVMSITDAIQLLMVTVLKCSESRINDQEQDNISEIGGSNESCFCPSQVILLLMEHILKSLFDFLIEPVSPMFNDTNEIESFDNFNDMAKETAEGMDNDDMLFSTEALLSLVFITLRAFRVHYKAYLHDPTCNEMDALHSERMFSMILYFASGAHCKNRSFDSRYSSHAVRQLVIDESFQLLQDACPLFFTSFCQFQQLLAVASDMSQQAHGVHILDDCDYIDELAGNNCVPSPTILILALTASLVEVRRLIISCMAYNPAWMVALIPSRYLPLKVDVKNNMMLPRTTFSVDSQVALDGREVQLAIGDFVCRGKDWKYDEDQDGNVDSTCCLRVGVVVGIVAWSDSADCGVRVRWPHTPKEEVYNWGYDDIYELYCVRQSSQHCVSSESAGASSDENLEPQSSCSVDLHLLDLIIEQAFSEMDIAANDTIRWFLFAVQGLLTGAWGGRTAGFVNVPSLSKFGWNDLSACEEPRKNVEWNMALGEWVSISSTNPSPPARRVPFGYLPPWTYEFAIAMIKKCATLIESREKYSSYVTYHLAQLLATLRDYQMLLPFDNLSNALYELLRVMRDICDPTVNKIRILCTDLLGKLVTILVSAQHEHVTNDFPVDCSLLSTRGSSQSSQSDVVCVEQSSLFSKGFRDNEHDNVEVLGQPDVATACLRCLFDKSLRPTEFLIRLCQWIMNKRKSLPISPNNSMIEAQHTYFGCLLYHTGLMTAANVTDLQSIMVDCNRKIPSYLVACWLSAEAHLRFVMQLSAKPDSRAAVAQYIANILHRSRYLLRFNPIVDHTQFVDDASEAFAQALIGTRAKLPNFPPNFMSISSFVTEESIILPQLHQSLVMAQRKAEFRLKGLRLLADCLIVLASLDYCYGATAVLLLSSSAAFGQYTEFSKPSDIRQHHLTGLDSCGPKVQARVSGHWEIVLRSVSACLREIGSCLECDESSMNMTHLALFLSCLSCFGITMKEEDHAVLSKCGIFDVINEISCGQEGVVAAQGHAEKSAPNSIINKALMNTLHYLVLQLVLTSSDFESRDCDLEAFCDDRPSSDVSQQLLAPKLQHCVSGPDSLSDTIFDILLGQLSSSIDSFNTSITEQHRQMIREILLLVYACACKSSNCCRIVGKSKWIAVLLRITMDSPAMMDRLTALKLLCKVLPETYPEKFDTKNIALTSSIEDLLKSTASSFPSIAHALLECLMYFGCSDVHCLVEGIPMERWINHSGLFAAAVAAEAVNCVRKLLIHESWSSIVSISFIAFLDMKVCFHEMTKPQVKSLHFVLKVLGGNVDSLLFPGCIVAVDNNRTNDCVGTVVKFTEDRRAVVAHAVGAQKSYPLTRLIGLSKFPFGELNLSLELSGSLASCVARNIFSDESDDKLVNIVKCTALRVLHSMCECDDNSSTFKSFVDCFGSIDLIAKLLACGLAGNNVMELTAISHYMNHYALMIACTHDISANGILKQIALEQSLLEQAKAKSEMVKAVDTNEESLVKQVLTAAASGPLGNEWGMEIDAFMEAQMMVEETAAPRFDFNEVVAQQSNADMLEQITAMGLAENPDQCKLALRLAGNNLAAAVELLLSGELPELSTLINRPGRPERIVGSVRASVISGHERLAAPGPGSEPPIRPNFSAFGASFQRERLSDQQRELPLHVNYLQQRALELQSENRQLQFQQYQLQQQQNLEFSSSFNALFQTDRLAMIDDFLGHDRNEGSRARLDNEGSRVLAYTSTVKILLPIFSKPHANPDSELIGSVFPGEIIRSSSAVEGVKHWLKICMKDYRDYHDLLDEPDERPGYVCTTSSSSGVRVIVEQSDSTMEKYRNLQEFPPLQRYRSFLTQECFSVRLAVEDDATAPIGIIPSETVIITSHETLNSNGSVCLKVISPVVGWVTRSRRGLSEALTPGPQIPTLQRMLDSEWNIHQVPPIAKIILPKAEIDQSLDTVIKRVYGTGDIYPSIREEYFEPKLMIENYRKLLGLVCKESLALILLSSLHANSSYSPEIVFQNICTRAVDVKNMFKFLEILFDESTLDQRAGQLTANELTLLESGELSRTLRGELARWLLAVICSSSELDNKSSIGSELVEKIGSTLFTCIASKDNKHNGFGLDSKQQVHEQLFEFAAWLTDILMKIFDNCCGCDVEKWLFDAFEFWCLFLRISTSFKHKTEGFVVTNSILETLIRNSAIAGSLYTRCLHVIPLPYLKSLAGSCVKNEQVTSPSCSRFLKALVNLLTTLEMQKNLADVNTALTCREDNGLPSADPEIRENRIVVNMIPQSSIRLSNHSNDIRGSWTLSMWIMRHNFHDKENTTGVGESKELGEFDADCLRRHGGKYRLKHYEAMAKKHLDATATKTLAEQAANLSQDNLEVAEPEPSQLKKNVRRKNVDASKPTTSSLSSSRRTRSTGGSVINCRTSKQDQLSIPCEYLLTSSSGCAIALCKGGKVSSDAVVDALQGEMPVYDELHCVCLQEMRNSTYHSYNYVAPCNEWIHLTLTFDSSTSLSSLYANGILQDRISHATSFALPLQHVGGTSGCTLPSFCGRIGFLGAWSRCRTSEEIKSSMYSCDSNDSTCKTMWTCDGEADELSPSVPSNQYSECLAPIITVAKPIQKQQDQKSNPEQGVAVNEGNADSSYVDGSVLDCTGDNVMRFPGLVTIAQDNTSFAKFSVINIAIVQSSSNSVSGSIEFCQSNRKYKLIGSLDSTHSLKFVVNSCDIILNEQSAHDVHWTQMRFDGKLNGRDISGNLLIDSHTTPSCASLMTIDVTSFNSSIILCKPHGRSDLIDITALDNNQEVITVQFDNATTPPESDSGESKMEIEGQMVEEKEDDNSSIPYGIMQSQGVAYSEWAITEYCGGVLFGVCWANFRSNSRSKPILCSYDGNGTCKQSDGKQFKYSGFESGDIISIIVDTNVGKMSLCKNGDQVFEYDFTWDKKMKNGLRVFVQLRRAAESVCLNSSGVPSPKTPRANGRQSKKVDKCTEELQRRASVRARLTALFRQVHATDAVVVKTISGKLEASSRDLFLLISPRVQASEQMNQPGLRIADDCRSVLCTGQGRSADVVHGSVSFNTGVHYWEVRTSAFADEDLSNIQRFNLFIGIATVQSRYTPSGPSHGGYSNGGACPSWNGSGITNNRQFVDNGRSTIYGDIFAPNATVGVLLDLNKGILKYMYEANTYGTIKVKSFGIAKKGINQSNQSFIPCFGIRKHNESLSLVHCNNMTECGIRQNSILSRVIHSNLLLECWQSSYASSKFVSKCTQRNLMDMHATFTRLSDVSEEDLLVVARSGLETSISTNLKNLRDVLENAGFEDFRRVRIGSLAVLVSEEGQTAMRCEIIGSRVGQIWYKLQSYELIYGVWYWDAAHFMALVEMRSAYSLRLRIVYDDNGDIADESTNLVEPTFQGNAACTKSLLSLEEFSHVLNTGLWTQQEDELLVHSAGEQAELLGTSQFALCFKTVDKIRHTTHGLSKFTPQEVYVRYAALVTLNIAGKHSVPFVDLISTDKHRLRHDIVSGAEEHHKSFSTSNMSLCFSRMKKLIFTCTKLQHWREMLEMSTTPSNSSEDGISRPRNMHEFALNRMAALSAAEAQRKRQQQVPFDRESVTDLDKNLRLSLLGQLNEKFKRARFTPEQMRQSYVDENDNGQPRSFYVKELGQGVDDHGGPYRAVFEQILGHECVHLLRLLVPCENFTTSEKQNRDKLVLNSKLTSDISRRQLYEMLGTMMGIACRHNMKIPLSLSNLILKPLIGQELILDDLQSISKATVQSLQALASATDADVSPVEVVQLLYSKLDETRISKHLKTRLQVVLRGAAQASTTPAEFKSVVAQVCKGLLQHKLTEHAEGMCALFDGLSDILPMACLALFVVDEVDELLCGKAVINVQALKDATVYGAVSRDDRHVKMFWRILETRLSPEELSQFANFCFGQSRLPSSAADYAMPFTIHLKELRSQAAVTSSSAALSGEGAELSRDELPCASVCFATLTLPRYTTEDIMAAKLLFAIKNANLMDNDFSERDNKAWESL